MNRKLDSLDYQMNVIKDFIDEFYNKTVFKNGKTYGMDLSPSFIKALFAFTDPGADYPIGALGDNARVKRSTITDMVDRLERDGVAERVRDGADRRVVRVRLTPRGKKIRQQFSRLRRTEFQGIFSKLKTEETRKLIYHLDQAYRILKKIN